VPRTVLTTTRKGLESREHTPASEGLARAPISAASVAERSPASNAESMAHTVCSTIVPESSVQWITAVTFLQVSGEGETPPQEEGASRWDAVSPLPTLFVGC
jgi:hypothetical protein